MKDKVIIGIDPGTIFMGYGILNIQGGKPHLEAMGILRLDRFSSHYERLLKIQEGVDALIKRYHPDAMALEAPFFQKNVQTTLKLGRAQGAAMIAALSHSISVCEYSPSTIKKAITGHGNASKEQVATMLQHILCITKDAMMEHLDATDGVAVALTHHIQETSPIPKSSKDSWADFIKNNPNRIIK